MLCNNRRIHSHIIFARLVERGKIRMGWFYGFKLHLITIERRDLPSLYLSTGNTDDRKPNVIQAMTKQIFGNLFENKGYLSSASFGALFANGIQFDHQSAKEPQRPFFMSLSDKILLRKRTTIETITSSPYIVRDFYYPWSTVLKTFLSAFGKGKRNCTGSEIEKP